jgi:SAM-dependent methyltransferase
MGIEAVEAGHKEEREILGRVVSGRGQATTHMAQFAQEIQAITDQPIYPGSLNVILEKPIRFDTRLAATFDGGSRMLWPASLNEIDVWVYRWQHTALHVVEVIAPVQLRSMLGLDDGSPVRLRIWAGAVTTISLTSYTAWAALWVGRNSWPYTRTGYYLRTTNIAQKLGATQRVPRKKASDMVFKLVKSLVSRVPVLHAAAAKLLGRSRAKAKYAFSRMATDGLRDGPLLMRQVRNLLAYTKTSNSAYNAEEFPAGYHSITLNGERLRGQREPGVRIDLAPVDFAGKSVLDIGSNQGGMLFQIRDKIRWGVGIDFDSRMVNAANRIRSALGSSALSFYVFDLEREPLDLIQDFLPEAKADICFLLSVCMWITNWRDVIDFASRHSAAMLFETNGSEQQQGEQIAYLRQIYQSVQKLSGESADDPGQRKRELYYLTDAA